MQKGRITMAEIKKTVSISNGHSVTMENRSKMSLTGVIDVSSFSEDKIEIVTNMGTLTVKGKKLNVNTLNTDTGELKLTGEVKCCEYSETRNKGGMFTGLFK